MGTGTQTSWSVIRWKISRPSLNILSSLRPLDGKTPRSGLGINWKVKDWITAERTQEEEEEEDKEEVVEAEAEVAEEMTTKKTEGWNHLESAEVATEERRGVDVAITMMSIRVTREDMGTEMIPDGEDMMMTECMMNTVIENMIEIMKKTETETTMRTEIEAVEEVIPTDMEAAKGNEEVTRGLRAIGGLL